MDRITALPRPRRPQQIPSHQRHPDRTGGHPGGTDRLNHEVEESHDDLVHHVPGLDPRIQRAGAESHYGHVELLVELLNGHVRTPNPNDGVESAFHEIVCNRTASLAAMPEAIAADWTIRSSCRRLTASDLLRIRRVRIPTADRGAILTS
jgi:hypothetical protein